MKIRIGHLSTFYHTAILLQAEGDAGQRLGTAVEWRLMGTGPAIMQAFQKGELDLAYVGLPPAIIGMDQGVDVVCIAGGHVEGTVMAAKANWKGFPDERDIEAVLAQFRGLTIGVPGKGSIHDVILKDSIERSGLRGSIEIRSYPWADLVTEAVVKDEVSAAFGTPALAIAIKRFANGKVLIPPARLWPDNPSYGIAAHRDFLSRHPGIVERFLLLHEEATQTIRNRPREAARMIAGYIGIIDQDFVFDTIALSPKYCAQLTDEYIESTMRFLPVLRRLGYIKTGMSEARIFRRDLISKIHPGGAHYGEGIADG
jgi:NitT/TauT family transport system substrate-binding protein